MTAPKALPASAAGTPQEFLHAHQRVNKDDKLLYAFIDWLLPNLKLKPEAQHTVKWDDFWRMFKADGTMGWEEFEHFLRWECKLNARKLFDILDEAGSGRISKYALLNAKRQYMRVIDCRHQGLDDLKVVLMRKHGNLVRAWRQLLDPQTRGLCSHAVFVKACKEVGFHGDVKGAWAELTGGQVHRPAVLADIDPVSDQMIMDFTLALKKYHGSPRDGWYAVMRAHGSYGKMMVEPFERVCRDMGFSAKFAKKMFNCMDIDLDRSVSLDEWTFLSLWDRRIGDDATDGGMVSVGLAAGNQTGARTSWQSAVTAGRGSDEQNTVEFIVVMTKEEHKEYLQRLHAADEARKPKSAVRAPDSPRKSTRASFADPALGPWGPLM